MDTGGWSSSLGRTQNFFDGGNSARLDSLGAMGETVKMEGPAGLHLSSSENKFAGYTANKPANIGTGG